MELRVRVTRTRLGLLAAAAAAVAAGAAYASIPDGSGVFHACRGVSTGTVRLIDKSLSPTSLLSHCTSAEREVSWGQTGPQGLQGLQGLQGEKGDKGDKGDTGPSAAYANYGDGYHTIGDGLTQTVASVTVPAGTYVLHGAAHGIGVDDLEFVQCGFVAGSTVNGTYAVLTSDESEPMLADVTLTGTSNPIFLRCNANGGTIQAAGQMVATLVGSVTASS